MVADINKAREQAKFNESEDQRKKEERRKSFEDYKEKTVNYYYWVYENKFNRVLLDGMPVKKSIYASDLIEHISKEFRFDCTDNEGYEVLVELTKKISQAYRDGNFTVSTHSVQDTTQDIKGYSEIIITF